MNGNTAFSRGFNMVMQMHGVKSEQERFKKRLALAERATTAQEKIAKLREKQQDEEDRLRGIKVAREEDMRKETERLFAPTETGVPDFSPMAGPGQTIQMPSQGEQVFGPMTNLAKMLYSTGRGAQIAPMMGQLKEEEPKEPKTATTAMGQFLKMHPESSEEEVLAFVTKLEKVSKKAGYKPTDLDKYIQVMKADYKEKTKKQPSSDMIAKWMMEWHRMSPFMQLMEAMRGGPAEERPSLETLHETK